MLDNFGFNLFNLMWFAFCIKCKWLETKHFVLDDIIKKFLLSRKVYRKPNGQLQHKHLFEAKKVTGFIMPAELYSLKNQITKSIDT